MSWFGEDSKTENVEVEKSSGFFAPSGVYKAKVKMAAVYENDATGSKGLAITFELESGIDIFQYVNYVNSSGKSTRENSNGKEVKGYGLEQVESWDAAIGLGKPDDGTTVCTMWGVEKNGRLFQSAIGKTVEVCVRHIYSEGEEYPDTNEIEMVVNIESNKTSGQLYYVEDDSRHISVDKWRAKIAKSPTLVRKQKVKKEAQKTDSSAAKANGW